MKKHISIGKIVKWGLGLALLASVLYIMFHHLGLIDSLDFGAGAYYYADIPGFEKYVDGSSYQSQTPMSVLILLFLTWGFLMYKGWGFLEKHMK